MLRPSGFAGQSSLVCERSLVGPGRVERPTSRLSGVRSNHLSYEPETRGYGFQDHFAKTIAIIRPQLARAFAWQRPENRRKKEGKRRRRFFRHMSKTMFGIGYERPFRKHHP